MTLFSRSLWPERIRYPYLRLILALVSAPSIVASVLTLLAYLAARSTEPTDALAMLITMRAARIFFIALPAFMLTIGLAGVAFLWATGRRGTGAWALTGAAAGLAVSLAHWALRDGLEAVQVAVIVTLGTVLFLLLRFLAGVRVS